ncbi:MAG: hypothetical protein ACKOEQ_01095, partial [Verrucomicrobiota bacterium]
MGRAVVSPDERADAGVEGGEAEEVAMALGDGPEEQGGADEVLEEWFMGLGSRCRVGRREDAAGQARGVEEDVHLL